MASHPINWLKIVANSGYMFFWMLVGFFTADTLFNLQIPFWEYVNICALIAFVNAGAVFCLELRNEAEDVEVKAELQEIAQKEEKVGESVKKEEETKDNPGKKGGGNGKITLSSLLYVF